MALSERRTVVTPIAGIIIEVLITPGTAIADDTEVAIVESMKMEIPVEAGTSGTLTELLVAVGDKVEEGQEIAVVS